MAGEAPHYDDLPVGTIYPGPDGKMHRKTGQAGPADPAPWAKADPVATGIGPTAEQGWQGFRKGVAETFDYGRGVVENLPEIMGRGAEALAGGRTQPYGDMIPPPNAASKGITGTQTDPYGAAQTITKRVGEELGAAAPTLAVPYAAAAIPERVAGDAITAATRGIRAAPVQTAARDVGQVAAGGFGAGVAKEAFPDSPAAEIAGQLGFIPPVSLAGKAAGWVWRRPIVQNAVSRATQFASPSARTQVAEDMAANVIGPQTPESAASLNRAGQLANRMPGFNPSLAEATGNPALRRMQERIEATSSGQDLNGLAARRQGNVSAVDNFANANAAGTDQPPSFVIDTANGRVERLNATIAGVRQGVENAQAALGGALPTADRAAVGAGMRESFAGSERLARDQMSARAAELGLNDLSMEGAPVSDLRSWIRTTFRGQAAPSSGYHPGQLGNILGSEVQPAVALGHGPTSSRVMVTPPAQGMTVGRLMSIRSYVARDIRSDLSGANPNAQRAFYNQQLLRHIDQALDQTDLGDAARTFRQEYVQNVIEPYENGSVFKVTQQNGRAFYTMPDEKIAGVFFQPGNVTAARQFRAVMGNDPEMMGAIQTAALDSFREKAATTGRIDPVAADQWMRQHRAVLDEFPDIRATLTDINTRNEALAGRMAQLDQREAFVQQNALVKQLNAYSRVGKTADDVINAALGDERLMAPLLRSVRTNAEAYGGLQRAVWDRAASLEGLKQERFLAMPSVQQVLGHDRAGRPTEHLDNLHAVLDARGMIANVRAPVGTASVVDPVAAVTNATGINPKSAVGTVTAVARGRSSKWVEAAGAAARVLGARTGQLADERIRDAIYNPQVAASMRNRLPSGSASTPKPNQPPNWSRLRYANLGLENRQPAQ